MSVMRAFWIECDECGNQAPGDLSASSQTQARLVANRLGFSRRRRVKSDPRSLIDVCRYCREPTP